MNTTKGQRLLMESGMVTLPAEFFPQELERMIARGNTGSLVATDIADSDEDDMCGSDSQ